MDSDTYISPLQIADMREGLLDALVECTASDEISQKVIDALYDALLTLGVPRAEIEQALSH